MAILRVNPTRMELTRLKKRLSTARRGHKLLKDKRDELMKQFLDIVRKNKDLREKVEGYLLLANEAMTMAGALMSSQNLKEALIYPKRKVELNIDYKNIMSVEVPRFSYNTVGEGDIYPYGFAFTSGELDTSTEILESALPYLLELAADEKAAQLLAAEIEKTRRRVNALEYVMIPQLEETIKSIAMKLDENERGNLTRLMKVKDMMLAEAIRQQIALDSLAN